MLKKIFNLFSKNLSLKLIAIGFALLFWLYVITEKHYEQEYSFPIRYKSLSKEYTFRYDLPDTIRAVFSGSGRNLIRMMYEESYATIDAGDYGLGSHRVVIADENFVLPFDGLELVSVIEPHSFEIVVDYMGQRIVPVENNLVVFPEDGYVVDGEIAFEPSEVIINGPESVLRRVNSISTKPETLRNLKVTTTRIVSLDTSLADVDVVSSKVTATIPVDDISQKQFRKIPVRMRGFPRGFKGLLQPTTIDLTIAGASQAIDEIEASDIEVYIDYGQLSHEGISNLRPIIKLPPEVRVSAKNPEYFKIEETQK